MGWDSRIALVDSLAESQLGCGWHRLSLFYMRDQLKIVLSRRRY